MLSVIVCLSPPTVSVTVWSPNTSLTQTHTHAHMQLKKRIMLKECFYFSFIIVIEIKDSEYMTVNEKIIKNVKS